MYDEIGMPSSHNVTVGILGGESVAEQNKGITPVFYMEPVENPAKSAEAGRPIFDQEERVRIFIAGDMLNQSVQPVTQSIRDRFPEQYRAWKEKKTERTISGTPLRSWAALSPSNVAEFEALNIFDVEGLASLSESAFARMQGLREWSTKARAYLECAANGADAAKYAEENLRLQIELEDQKKLVTEMAARLDALEAASSKRRANA